MVARGAVSGAVRPGPAGPLPRGPRSPAGGGDGADADAAAERRIGYVGHHPGLYPELTSKENLELFCALYGLPRRRAAEALAGVGVDPGLTARGRELSRGTQQRVALARSLLHDPELWILDEPDASLDARGRSLLEGAAGSRTVVIATHDRDLAGSLCGRAFQLRDGRLEARPPLEVLRS